jgi:hypothetical protein
LNTPPLAGSDDGAVVFSQLQHKDVLTYLVAAKSFGHHTGYGRFVLLDDGSLTAEDRALLREHKRTSDLFAKMSDAYGKQRTVEMMELAGDYWTVGTMMNAGDQHLPATRLPLMPPLARDGRRVD